jgi:aspartokinase
MSSSTSVLDAGRAWVVLKFGGTSVSNAANWHNIAAVIRARIAANLRPVVVHSALSGITDRLESLLAAAIHAKQSTVFGPDRCSASHARRAIGY